MLRCSEAGAAPAAAWLTRIARLRCATQLDEFASQPGKAAFFRETGAEHKNVDENSPEGTFLPVRRRAVMDGAPYTARPPVHAARTRSMHAPR